MVGFSSSLRLSLKYDPEVHLFRSRELKNEVVAVVAESDGDRSTSPTRHYLFIVLIQYVGFVCNIMRASEEAKRSCVLREERMCHCGNANGRFTILLAVRF